MTQHIPLATMMLPQSSSSSYQDDCVRDHPNFKSLFKSVRPRDGGGGGGGGSAESSQTDRWMGTFLKDLNVALEKKKEDQTAIPLVSSDDDDDDDGDSDGSDFADDTRGDQPHRSGKPVPVQSSQQEQQRPATLFDAAYGGGPPGGEAYAQSPTVVMRADSDGTAADYVNPRIVDAQAGYQLASATPSEDATASQGPEPFQFVNGDVQHLSNNTTAARGVGVDQFDDHASHIYRNDDDGIYGDAGGGGASGWQEAAVLGHRRVSRRTAEDVATFVPLTLSGSGDGEEAATPAATPWPSAVPADQWGATNSQPPRPTPAPTPTSPTSMPMPTRPTGQDFKHKEKHLRSQRRQKAHMAKKIRSWIADQVITTSMDDEVAPIGRLLKWVHKTTHDSVAVSAQEDEISVSFCGPPAMSTMLETIAGDLGLEYNSHSQ